MIGALIVGSWQLLMDRRRGDGESSGFPGATGGGSALKEQGGFVERIAMSGRSPRERLTNLFYSGLARRPTKSEMNVAGKLLSARRGNEKEMLQDMWWAIINSNEFIMQH